MLCASFIVTNVAIGQPKNIWWFASSGMKNTFSSPSDSGEVATVPEPHIQRPMCPFLPTACGGMAAAKCVVPAQQPVVPVPVYQEIQKKDRIVEIPQTVVKDKVFPKLYHQEVYYEVPKLSLQFNTRKINLSRLEFKEKIIDVPVPVGWVLACFSCVVLWLDNCCFMSTLEVVHEH